MPLWRLVPFTLCSSLPLSPSFSLISSFLPAFSLCPFPIPLVPSNPAIASLESTPADKRFLVHSELQSTPLMIDSAIAQVFTYTLGNNNNIIIHRGYFVFSFLFLALGPYTPEGKIIIIIISRQSDLHQGRPVTYKHAIKQY